MRNIILLSVLFINTSFAALSENYSDVKSVIQSIAARYPSTAKIIEIGLSDSGEQIKALKIGNGGLHNLLVATHHGNEYGSTEMALAFAESVAQAPISGQSIYIIPVLNISGYNERNREEIAHGNSFDPNRDYPGPCGTEGPFNLRSTRALAQFIDKENIVSSATLHSYFPAVVYPWGLSSRDLSTPYQDIFQKMVALATEESRYETGNSSEVIYPADGTFEDYAYWQHGIWSILFELGFSHSPNENAVAEMVRVNMPGMRRMFENSQLMRAPDHAFRGECDMLMSLRDRHDE